MSEAAKDKTIEQHQRTIENLQKVVQSHDKTINEQREEIARLRSEIRTLQITARIADPHGMMERSIQEIKQLTYEIEILAQQRNRLAKALINDYQINEEQKDHLETISNTQMAELKTLEDKDELSILPRLFMEVANTTIQSGIDAYNSEIIRYLQRLHPKGLDPIEHPAEVIAVSSSFKLIEGMRHLQSAYLGYAYAMANDSAALCYITLLEIRNYGKVSMKTLMRFKDGWLEEADITYNNGKKTTPGPKKLADGLKLAYKFLHENKQNQNQLHFAQSHNVAERYLRDSLRWYKTFKEYADGRPKNLDFSLPAELDSSLIKVAD